MLYGLVEPRLLATMSETPITDIVAKCIGSTNPYNVVRATLNGLFGVSTPAEIAAKRGKSVQDILE